MHEIDLRSVRDAHIKGKRVLLRTSLNVPVADGVVVDSARLLRGLPTLRYLVEQGAEEVVIVGYLGREGASLEPVARALSKLAPDLGIAFEHSGKCVVLENVRKDPGEEKNDAALAQKLAARADIFVSDAFAEAHRSYASNVGVAKFLPSFAGLLMEEEVKKLSIALEPQKPAVAIIGGAKFETKEPLLKKLLQLYDRIFMGGALGNDLLRSRGFPVGASLVADALAPTALASEDRLIAPDDTIVSSDDGKFRTANTADVRSRERIVDIGPSTAARWSEEIARAQFILWNGPVGLYEAGYTSGTDALAEALISSKARAVVGGGDTIAAISKHTFDQEKVFLSTGGGAMLQFLVDGTLPGLEVLRRQSS